MAAWVVVVVSLVRCSVLKWLVLLVVLLAVVVERCERCSLVACGL